MVLFLFIMGFIFGIVGENMEKGNGVSVIPSPSLCNYDKFIYCPALPLKKYRLELFQVARQSFGAFVYRIIESSDSATKYVVSISILPKACLIRVNETYSKQLRTWRSFQKDISSKLNEFLLDTIIPILGGVSPISMHVLPFKIRSEIYYKLIVVLSQQDVIPKISEFITSSDQFKSLISSLNCTDYDITDETSKRLDDLGQIWTDLEKEQYRLVM